MARAKRKGTHTMTITYRTATIADIKEVAELSSLMHSPPYTTDEDLTIEECTEMHREEFESDDEIAFFLAFDGSIPVGLSYVTHKYEYVEGTDMDGTTGYLEGIYVKPNYRNKGIAKNLVDMCENWAKEQGAREFASGCLIDNNESLAFHLKYGFEETQRIICFNKKI